METALPIFTCATTTGHRTGFGSTAATARSGCSHASPSGIPSENSMGVDFADVDRDGHVDGLVLDMLSRDPELRRRQVLAQTPMSTRRARSTIVRRSCAMCCSTIGVTAPLPRSRITPGCRRPTGRGSRFSSMWISMGYEDVLIRPVTRATCRTWTPPRAFGRCNIPGPPPWIGRPSNAQFTREMMEHAG